MIKEATLHPSDPVTVSPEPAAAGARRKVYFTVTPSQWLWDTVFLLSLAMVGLRFPLGYPLVLLLLLRAFKIDREGFLFMLMLTAGGYALTESNTMWGINLQYVVFMVSLYGMCVLRKYKELRNTLILYGIYVATTFAFAFMSEESLRPQIGKILHYISFIFFVVPLMVFADRTFDLNRFWNRVFSMQFILCVFYILDAYVFRGWVMIPCSLIGGQLADSTWNGLVMGGPFASYIPRKYPPGLFSLALLMYPLARYYKMRWWQWAVMLVAVACTRTFTMWLALPLGYVIAMGSLKRYLKYVLIGIPVLVGLYFVDDAMGYSGENQDQSTLRIASSVNQFIFLGETEDEEDLAEFGSNRIAQAIPAFELIYEQGREWIGQGFIPLDTNNPRFLIKNEFFEDPDLKYVCCQNVEIIGVQVFLEVGYIGLAIHIAFLIGLWMIIRRQKEGRYFLSVMWVIITYGMSGFRGWHDSPGIYIGAMAYAVILLYNHRGEPLPFGDDDDNNKAADSASADRKSTLPAHLADVPSRSGAKE